MTQVQFKNGVVRESNLRRFLLVRRRRQCRHQIRTEKRDDDGLEEETKLFLARRKALALNGKMSTGPKELLQPKVPCALF